MRRRDLFPEIMCKIQTIPGIRFPICANALQQVENWRSFVAPQVKGETGETVVGGSLSSCCDRSDHLLVIDEFSGIQCLIKVRLRTAMALLSACSDEILAEETLVVKKPRCQFPAERRCDGTTSAFCCRSFSLFRDHQRQPCLRPFRFRGFFSL